MAVARCVARRVVTYRQKPASVRSPLTSILPISHNLISNGYVFGVFQVSTRGYSSTAAPTAAVNFRDPAVFKSKSTKDLLFNYAILRACTVSLLTDGGPKVLEMMDKLKISGALAFGTTPARDELFFCEPRDTAFSKPEQNFLLPL
jgi:hypothetical protein